MRRRRDHNVIGNNDNSKEAEKQMCLCPTKRCIFHGYSRLVWDLTTTIMKNYSKKDDEK